MMTMILTILFYILIFPGLLFCVTAGLLLSGIDRKLVARMQGRVGPPVTQPIYDFFKLLGKETIIPAAANKKVFLTAPVVGFISLVTIALFIPIKLFMPMSGVADVVVILYLLCIPSLALIVGGAASGSPFAGVGISREMVAIIAYELPLAIILLTVGKLAGVGGVTFSFDEIELYQAYFGPNIAHWSMLPAAVAMLLVIPCEAGSHPFDIAEAETEICEGPLCEYSGRPLAVFKLNAALKTFVMPALFTALFLGGMGTGRLWLDVLIFLAECFAVMFVSMTLPHAICARLKVEQTFKFYWTTVTGLAICSFALVWLGV
ncbi:MAG: NADH-quinone oxidoreductase subunit H [Eubacteriales bacterium]|nr:NADH-quinone oxidoreductase subunit H [Eubacteriales bacterium]